MLFPGRNSLYWPPWCALTSSVLCTFYFFLGTLNSQRKALPSEVLCWVLSQASAISFPLHLVCGSREKNVKMQKEAVLWYWNIYRNEQILHSGALSLGRHLIFSFWLSALRFAITSANSVASESLLSCALPRWQLQACCQHKAFFPELNEGSDF